MIFYFSNSHFFSGQSRHASSPSIVLYLWLGARRPTASGRGDRGLPDPLLLSHPCALAHIVAHVVALLQQPHRCPPSTQPLLSPTLFYAAVNAAVVCHRHPRCCCHVVFTPVIVHRRRHHCHDRRFHQYRCCFLADCCLWTLPGALPTTPPPLFVTLFDDIVLPPWALVSDDADSRRANARWSLGCRRPPPFASVHAHGNGLFALLLLSALSPALAAVAAE
jgi:hypothetical protein